MMKLWRMRMKVDSKMKIGISKAQKWQVRTTLGVHHNLQSAYKLGTWFRESSWCSNIRWIPNRSRTRRIMGMCFEIVIIKVERSCAKCSNAYIWSMIVIARRPEIYRSVKFSVWNTASSVISGCYLEEAKLFWALPELITGCGFIESEFLFWKLSCSVDSFSSEFICLIWCLFINQ